MERNWALAALAFTIAGPAACGGLTSVEHGSPTETSSPGADASSAGAQGDASPMPSVADDATSSGPDDSNTLHVDVSVSVVPRLGASADTSSVRVLVYVTEAATHAPVVDATVMGGPIGHVVPLEFNQPPTYGAAPHYGGFFTGYGPDWEFSVVRGGDYLKGVRLVGPSYPTIGLEGGWVTVRVLWSPAEEPNVTTSVCAWLAASGSPGLGQEIHQGWCAQGHDEGSVVLSEADAVGSPGVPTVTLGTSYFIQLVEGLGQVPVGSQGGTASFDLVVDSEATIGP
jgi:hypothetical protein